MGWGGGLPGSSHPPPTATLRADGSSEAAACFLLPHSCWRGGGRGGARERKRNKGSQTAPICCGKIIMLAFTQLFDRGTLRVLLFYEPSEYTECRPDLESQLEWPCRGFPASLKLSFPAALVCAHLPPSCMCAWPWPPALLALFQFPAIFTVHALSRSPLESEASLGCPCVWGLCRVIVTLGSQCLIPVDGSNGHPCLGSANTQ